MGKKRKGKAARNARKGAIADNEEEYKKYPHSFVFHRGNVGRNIGLLVRDMRQVMEPYTASNLKVRKNNTLRDFVSVAGPMNITHFIIFTKTTLSSYMRVLRLPRGPTLTFKISSYSLCKDIVSSLKRPSMEPKQFRHHPLLVMNGFSGEGMHLKLMTTMFQNLFPSINVNKVNLSDVRRCVLLNYSAEDGIIEFRQYNIKAVPVGISKGVRKLIKAKVPDMGKYEDLSELLLRGGDLSGSEAELDGPHNEVVLPQNLSSRGNIKSAKSAIRLTEVGPRITLQLFKIEDGICQGEVLYHSLVEKTEEEKKLLEMRRIKKRKLKEQRKRIQEENVRRKMKLKEELKKKCLAGMKKAEKDSGFEEVGRSSEEGHVHQTNMENSDDEDDIDDDISYYRQEVGEEPDPEMFPSRVKDLKKRKHHDTKQRFPNKRRKMPDAKAVDTSEKDSKKKTNKKGPLTEMDLILRRKQRKKRQLMKKSGKKKIHPHKKMLSGKSKH